MQENLNSGTNAYQITALIDSFKENCYQWYLNLHRVSLPCHRPGVWCRCVKITQPDFQVNISFILKDVLTLMVPPRAGNTIR